MIVCEKKQKEKQWVIEINSLEELIKFQEKYGEIMILDSLPYKEVKKEIRIVRAK
jgi:nicotinate-nucleotide pyrophosphorylase